MLPRRELVPRSMIRLRVVLMFGSVLYMSTFFLTISSLFCRYDTRRDDYYYYYCYYYYYYYYSCIE